MKTHLSRMWFGSMIVLLLGGQLMAIAAPESFESATTPLIAVAPGYPPLALSSGIAGEVTVRVAVNQKGIVTSAEIIDGHRLLREGCKEAGLQWKFTPANEEDQNKRTAALKFVFIIAPRDTATMKLTTVFRHPNTMEITRRVPPSGGTHRR